MSDRRVGLWFIGALGGVASTAALGLAALRRNLCDTTSLVTAYELYERFLAASPVGTKRRTDCSTEFGHQLVIGVLQIGSRRLKIAVCCLPGVGTC